ncbi:MAG: YcxB family protein [Oscillospiraceae bacterium]|nr:YcxB family protein [Oscillospiraceae bacterium]
MKITYKFDEDELYAFNYFRATRKNAGTIPTAIMIACAYLAAMLVIGYMCKFPVYTYFIMVGLAVAVFGFIMWFLRRKMKKSVKVMLYRQRKEDLMPQTTITLEEDYFEVYTVSRTSEIEYSSVERIEKSKQFIYLELDMNGEMGIPLRAFDSDQQRDDFLREFIEKTPKAVHVGLGDLMKKEHA